MRLFQRYSETLKFLINLEKKCVKPEIVSSLKEHAQYKQFLKKWNLPVYFQIRFQEIAGSAESVLYEDPSLSSMIKDRQTVDSKDFSLYATKMIWDCLLRTWSNEVFLVQLLHRYKSKLNFYRQFFLNSFHISFSLSEFIFSDFGNCHCNCCHDIANGQ